MLQCLPESRFTSATLVIQTQTQWTPGPMSQRQRHENEQRPRSAGSAVWRSHLDSSSLKQMRETRNIKKKGDERDAKLN